MDLMTGLEQLLQQLGQFFERFDHMNINFDFGTGAAGVAAYIFMALGLYAIARNRQIKNPWLAWVPVGNLWLLGSIADQYRYCTTGEDPRRRKRMLTLGIVEAALVPVVVTVLICGAVLAFVVGNVTYQSAGAGAMAVVAVLVLLLAVVAIALAVVGIMLQVQRCYAYYELFSSCVPQRKKLYSALSIVASCLGTDLVAAIFIFLCRDKEEGMPPRAADVMNDE